MFNPVVMVVYLLILIGLVVLQVFLSRREGKLPGLVLPLLTLLYSVLAVLNTAVVEEALALEVFGTCAEVFLLSNIPTLILLAIYFGCRESRKRKRQMNKMNVQDLE